jgi:hypothetical protein
MNEKEWYIDRDSKIIGPFALEQMKELVKIVDFATTDRVMRRGWNSWQSVSNLEDYLTSSTLHQANTIASGIDEKGTQEWTMLLNNETYGPVDKFEIIAKIKAMPDQSPSALIKHESWSGWRQAKEILPELFDSNRHTNEHEKRLESRISTDGRVVLHNDQIMSEAKCLNLSTKGILISTTGPSFFLHEKVKLTFSLGNSQLAFNATAEVIRKSHHDDPKSRCVALCFDNIKPSHLAKIKKFITDHNS